MANILLISENKSFIIASLIEQLEGRENKVLQSYNNPSEIDKLEEEINAIIITMDEKLINEMKLLVYLKDKAIEEDIPIFIIGDADQMEQIENVIPKQFIKNEFTRPLNVKEVVSHIDDFLKDDAYLQKKKILVVDDSGAMLRSVKAWLEDKYQVILANSGAMAIKYLAMNHPDLILLDYEMPICDGSQVLEMIRSEPDFSTVPVIFLTSKNDKESVMKVTALKPDGYLLKTMEPDKIVQTIDDFFEKRKGL